MRRSHNRNRTPLPNCSPVFPLCTELRSTARRLNRCGSLTSSRGLMCRTTGLLRRRSHPQVAAQDDTSCRSKTSWPAGAHSFWHGRNQSVRSSKGAESSANFDARSYADRVPVAPALCTTSTMRNMRSGKSALWSLRVGTPPALATPRVDRYPCDDGRPLSADRLPSPSPSRRNRAAPTFRKNESACAHCAAASAS